MVGTFLIRLLVILAVAASVKVAAAAASMATPTSASFAFVSPKPTTSHASFGTTSRMRPLPVKSSASLCTFPMAATSSSSTALSASAVPFLSSAASAAAVTSASIHLSTVSADIENIPTDQFGLVFAGGIVVMAGGLVSALIVGAILESGNNYANVIADSYAQGGDESFWESLTPEQKEETERLLKKVKGSKEVAADGGSDSGDGVVEGQIQAASEAKTGMKKEERSMFSDYD